MTLGFVPKPLTSLTDMLNSHSFEINLSRVEGGDYVGRAHVFGAKGEVVRKEVRVVPGEKRVYVTLEGAVVGAFEEVEPDIFTILDPGCGLDTIFLQYESQRDGPPIILSVSKESKLLREESLTESTTIVDKKRTRRKRTATKPAENLLETNPLLYLAQGIERRIRAEKVYDFTNNTINFSHGTITTLDQILPSREISGETGHSEGVINRWKSSGKNHLVKHYDSQGIAAESVLAVILCDVSRTRIYNDESIAKFFGIKEEDVQRLSQNGLFSGEKIQAVAVRTKFREAYDLVIATIREGKTLLNGSDAIDYKLQYYGEKINQATENIATAYQREFNRRLLRELAKEGKIKGDKLKVPGTKKSRRLDAMVQKEEVAVVAGKNKNTLHGFLTRWNLHHPPFYDSKSEKYAVALALFTSPPSAGKGKISLKNASTVLFLDEQKDDSLIRYLNESGLLKGKVSTRKILEYSDFSTIYTSLAAGFVEAMRNPQQRKSLFQEFGK